MLAQLELLFVNLYKILDLTQMYKTPRKVYGRLFHRSSQKGSQCPEVPGGRDMGTLPGHAEFLPCSHPYFPSISTDIAISALSIKLHNKLLSKITLERNLILDSPLFLQHLHEAGEQRPGHTFPYAAPVPWNRGLPRSLQLKQKLPKIGKEAEPWRSPSGLPLLLECDTS